jgi:hypothetical protein
VCHNKVKYGGGQNTTSLLVVAKHHVLLYKTLQVKKNVLPVVYNRETCSLGE